MNIHAHIYIPMHCMCVYTYDISTKTIFDIAVMDDMKLRKIIFLTLFNFLILTINLSCFKKQIAVRLFPKTEIKIQNCQIMSKITSLS